MKIFKQILPFAAFMLSLPAFSQELEPNMDDIHLFARARFFEPAYHPLIFARTKVASQVVDLWDAQSNSWDEFVKMTNVHTTNCGRVSSSDVDVLGGLFSVNYAPTYDASNRLTLITEADPTVTPRVVDRETRFFYNGTATLPDSVAVIEYGSSPSRERYTYTYDANQNVATIGLKHVKNGALVDSARAFLTHSANGNLTKYSLDVFENNAWVHSYSYTFTYNAQNMFTRIAIGPAIDTMHADYKYDATNRLSQIFAIDMTSAPDTFGRYIMSNYTTTGYPQTLTYSQKNANGVFVLDNRDLVTYNNLGYVLTDIYQENTAGVFTNDNRETFTYCIPSNGLNEKAKTIDNQIVVSPNPASDEVRIAIEGNQYTNFDVQIFDLNGRMMKQMKNVVNNTTINIADLPAGLFQVHIQTADGTAVKKVMKF